LFAFLLYNENNPNNTKHNESPIKNKLLKGCPETIEISNQVIAESPMMICTGIFGKHSAAVLNIRRSAICQDIVIVFSLVSMQNFVPSKKSRPRRPL